MTDIFKDAKVGDKVYDLKYGTGVVDHIFREDFEIAVNFGKTDINEHYCMSTGIGEDTNNRTLYWEKPDIIEKPRKKKVKIGKIIYKDIDEEYFMTDTFYTEKEFNLTYDHRVIEFYEPTVTEVEVEE